MTYLKWPRKTLVGKEIESEAFWASFQQMSVHVKIPAFAGCLNAETRKTMAIALNSFV